MKKKVTVYPSKFIDDQFTIFEVCDVNHKYDYLMLVKGEYEIDYCTVEQMKEWKIEVVQIIEK